MAAADVDTHPQPLSDPTTATHLEVGTPEQHLQARLSLLEKEKSLYKLKDALSAERRLLPLVPIPKSGYKFLDLDPTTDKPTEVSLQELFGNKPQLIVYHAMFAPSATEACNSCTLYLDHVPPLEHLASRGVAFVVVSRAKPEQIKRYKDQMEYTSGPLPATGAKNSENGARGFRWLSSHESSFNYDFQATVDPPKNSTYNFRSAQEHIDRGMPFFAAGEQPGHSVFVKGGPVEKGGVGRGEEGVIYHSYSSYGRGGEGNLGVYAYLDMVPLGRRDQLLEGAPGLGFRRRGEYSAEEIGGV